MKIALLGAAGLIARVIVRDLLECADLEQLLLADVDLEEASATLESLGDERLVAADVDISDLEATAGLLEGQDVVINCLPHRHNLDVMKAALQAQVHYVDQGGLFHMTRKQLTLDHEYREAGLVAVLGGGSAPGLTNVMARHACDALDRVSTIDIRLASADLSTDEEGWRAPSSLETVLDECLVPAPIFEQGQWVELPPLSGREEVAFPPPIGSATAHYAIHSEIATLPLSFHHQGIERVTCRIAFPPDRFRILKMLVSLRLANPQPVDVKGHAVSPRDLLVAVLGPGGAGGDAMSDEAECLRVEVQGMRAGKPVTHILETLVLPHVDLQVGGPVHISAVTTSIVAQMLARHEIARPGVLAPEHCLDPQVFFRRLGRRGIRLQAIVREDLN